MENGLTDRTIAGTDNSELEVRCRIWGFPKIRGTFVGGPYNKDYSILVSILGSPYFGKLPFRVGVEVFLDRPVDTKDVPFSLRTMVL